MDQDQVMEPHFMRVTSFRNTETVEEVTSS